MDGHFRPGQRFLSIRQLIRETKRSLPTVRSALDLLVEEGLLEAKLGSGFYVTSKVDERREQSIPRLLVIIPSYITPREPWFTGRMVAGMLQAAEEINVVISFYQRKMIYPFEVKDDSIITDIDAITACNLQHILAFRPDGVAWVQGVYTELPQLNTLLERNIPIVSTIRHLCDDKIPIVREDDYIFASLILTQFQAKGHRRIGIITRPLGDDYFDSKLKALSTVGESVGVTVDENDYFEVDGVPQRMNPSEESDSVESLESFFVERPEMTGVLILVSSGIIPMIKVLEKTSHEAIKRVSIIHNVLDGMLKIPRLPTGEDLAVISPPLEDIGSRIVHMLGSIAKHAPTPPAKRLIPVFKSGGSLREAVKDSLHAKPY